MADWSTACPDWESRLLSGRPLVPDLPLFREEADRALRIFKRLRLPDVIGNPTMAEACEGCEWFYPVVEALFGSYDPQTNVRMIQEYFQLIPKGNAKSTNGGAIMVVAMIMTRRPAAEYLMVSPTKEIADIAFKQAAGIIALDPELAKLFKKPQFHLRKLTHLKNAATLQIKAADTDVITGGKALGTMIDETHEFAQRSNAAGVFIELRGALGKRPDGFLFQTTTQSKQPPAGQFKDELQKARDVRDGKVKLPVLPILYELPLEMARDGGWKKREYWPLVNPNLDRSLSRQFLEDQLAAAEMGGADKMVLLASQHFNVEIGLGLQTDSWAGAEFWERCAEPGLTLDKILERCDIVVVGIDGGGLDDLLGLSVLGRDRANADWLHWGHAWAHQSVFDRRKEIVPKLLDFAADNELTIVDRVGDDVAAVGDIVERIESLGLFPRKIAIGVDQAGIGAIVDEVLQRGIAIDRIAGVPQGWKLTGAIKTAERKLAGGAFWHCGSKMMAWQVGNAKVEARGNAIVITKQAAGYAKIDALMALFDAVVAMGQNPEMQSVYSTDERPDGLLIIGAA